MLFILFAFSLVLPLKNVYSFALNESSKLTKLDYPVDISSIIFDYLSSYELIKIMTETGEFTNYYKKTKNYKTFTKEINSNETKNKMIWKEVIQKNDIKTLKQMKLTGINMTFTNIELIDIVKSFKYVECYETFEFFFNYIKLDNYIASNLIFKILTYLKTPNTEQQQQIQLKIIKKLAKYQIGKDWLNYYFDDVIKSFNIPLVCFVIDKFKINISVLFYGKNVLQIVVDCLINNPNVNNEFAYEMFHYLLSIGADINKRDNYGKDIYFTIERIIDKTIKNEINKIIQNHNTSKYLLIKEIPKKQNICTKLNTKLCSLVSLF